MAGYDGAPAATAWRRALRVVLGVALVGIVAVALRERIGLPDHAPRRTITLYGFSVLQEPFENALLPAFRGNWEQRTGERIEFITTFAGSGLIVDEILRRFPAEIAILSSETDAYRLIRGGILPGATWRTLPHGGVLASTPIVLRVRAGNPAGVRGLADLAREDLAIVLPDPITSGCGACTVLAVWADAIRSGADADGRLAALHAATVARPPSARAARMAFDGGIGDVVALYEVEARVALDGETVVPPETLLVEPIVCVVPRNVAAEKQDLIEALIEFLWSDEAKAVLAGYGYRVAGPEGAEMAPGSPGTFRLADVGDPRDLGTDVLEGAWREAEVRRSRGGR